MYGHYEFYGSDINCYKYSAYYLLVIYLIEIVHDGDHSRSLVNTAVNHETKYNSDNLSTS